jgi:hypothetical protein
MHFLVTKVIQIEPDPPIEMIEAAYSKKTVTERENGIWARSATPAPSITIQSPKLSDMRRMSELKILYCLHVSALLLYRMCISYAISA